MTFTIITHVVHSKHNGKYYAYEPYVREMNLWLKHVDKVIIVAPLEDKPISKIDIFYEKEKIDFRPVPSFNLLTWKNKLKTLLVSPKVCYSIYKACKESNHIHLRCPGNIGLLGSLVQTLFPRKIKTAKYAGNWDPDSKQPSSYNFQKWILSNTFFTKNISVLVYGQWENQSKNIVPFFTASFSKEDIVTIEPKPLNSTIHLLFVGAFSEGKQPLLSVKVAHELLRKGYQIVLDMYGDGTEVKNVTDYIDRNSLHEMIKLHGNQPKEEIKKAFKKSHFLIFISKSEGWPKVIAESMFFSCLPISSKVSCVPYMLDNGKRGTLVDSYNENEIAEEILGHIEQPANYNEKVVRARDWSQKFTLEHFESEIKKFLLHE